MTKPICVNCQRFYKPERNGVWVLESMPKYNGAKSGNSDQHAWKPYKVWRADLLACHGCGHTIVSGFGQHPVAVQHEEHFDKYLKLTTITVNDC